MNIQTVPLYCHAITVQQFFFIRHSRGKKLV